MNKPVNNPRPGWTGAKRDDSTLVVHTFSGLWFVLPSDDRPAFSHCPACNCELRSEDAAKAVADYCVPPLSTT